jgi:hypothetical protein
MGEWMYRDIYFFTLALAGGEWPASHPQYPLDRRLGGPQNRSRLCGGVKKLASTGIQTPAVQPIALAIPTVLSWLPNER